MVMNEQVKGRVKITEDMFRVDDYDLMEKLENIYYIEPIDYDEETSEFVYAEPVHWIYEGDRYEVYPEDYN